jgi:hypothetical protein
MAYKEHYFFIFKKHIAKINIWESGLSFGDTGKPVQDSYTRLNSAQPSLFIIIIIVNL